MNRIKEIIKEKGFTQQAFANKLGITRGGLIQLLESPSYPSLERIATALDVPLWQLFATTEEVQETKNTIICPHCGKPIELDVK